MFLIFFFNKENQFTISQRYCNNTYLGVLYLIYKMIKDN
jgi:hypothetical protein